MRRDFESLFRLFRTLEVWCTYICIGIIYLLTHRKLLMNSRFSEIITQISSPSHRTVQSAEHMRQCACSFFHVTFTFCFWFILSCVCGELSSVWLCSLIILRLLYKRFCTNLSKTIIILYWVIGNVKGILIVS